MSSAYRWCVLFAVSGTSALVVSGGAWPLLIGAAAALVGAGHSLATAWYEPLCNELLRDLERAKRPQDAPRSDAS